jgi:hypothetical protein
VTVRPSRVAAVALALLVAVVALAARRAAVAADDPESIAGELVRAAGRNDASRLSAALDRAVALAGKHPKFQDVAAVADWIGTLPGSVGSHRAVAVRRGWMYVTAKRGDLAVPVLEAALASGGDAVARAYLGEARRQAGQPLPAAADLAQALREGAPREYVLPSVSKLLFDLRREPAPSSGLPPYAAAAGTVLAASDLPEIRLEVARWLAFDAEGEKDSPERRSLLFASALRHAWAWLERPPEDVSPARPAWQASEWRRALGDAAPGDLPARYDLLAIAVRAGGTGEVDEVPEAVAALAEVALEERRYALAHAMAKRRLALSDSPAARRVLLALPPDAGR